MDLDSILDEALDEFEERQNIEQNKEAHQAFVSSTISVNSSNYGQETTDNRTRDELEELFNVLHNDRSLQDILPKTLKTLNQTEEGIQHVDHLFQYLQDNKKDILINQNDQNDSNTENFGETLGEREIAETLKLLSLQTAKASHGVDLPQVEFAGEDLMEGMIAEFEELGEKEDYNEVIDGVMRQLLSKDLMYEPVKLINDKFPEWLALHRPSLTSSEYNNYGLQYQAFQKIQAVYDTEPENFPRLMELLMDVQQYGQPPGDLIRELAPGLEFDENGLPILFNQQDTQNSQIFSTLSEGMAGLNPMNANNGQANLPDMANLPQQMAMGQCTIC